VTKSLKLALGIGAVLGLLTSAHAKSLLANHGHVVACSDCDVPGAPLFTTFGSEMTNPSIAEDGTVLFRSNLAGPTITQANSRALFAGTLYDNLMMLVQWSDPAPGLPGLYLVNNAGAQGIAQERIAPDGRTIWTSRLTNDARNVATNVDTAIFGGFPGSFSLIAREGSPAPGTAGAVYADFSSLSTQFMAMNRNGSVLFYTGLVGGDVVGSTNNDAIYGGTIAAPTLAVRRGATMLPGPVTAAAFSGQLQLDNNGRILYNLRLAGAGVTTANDESIWLYTPGSGNTLLLREGDPAPGTVGAILSTNASLTTPQMSVNSFTRSGKYSVLSVLDGGDVNPDVNDSAIFVGTTGGALTLLSRKGSPAPGTDGVFDGYSPFFNYIADSGRVAFQAVLRSGTVVDANDTGIWVGTAGALSLVAREGAFAPGTDGAKFGSLIGQPMIYSDFGIVFHATLQGGDVVRSTNHRGIFAWTPANGTFLVARSGESMEVTPGIFKTTSGFGTLQFGNTDGAALGFSNDGTLATVTFFDAATSGTSVVTVDLNCAPATDYYLDADHDGHGDPATEISLCVGQLPPPGYITTSGDCLDSNGSALGQSAEICNGIDDDCDARIDEGIAIPSGPLTMNLGKVGANAILSWNAVPGASAYDIVSGDLTELRGAGSFQFLSQASCVGDDLAGPTFSSSSNPSSGNGIWWVMRPLNCAGDGTYNSGSPAQAVDRNTQILQSIPAYGCP
jgi:hypothetical protein